MNCHYPYQTNGQVFAPFLEILAETVVEKEAEVVIDHLEIEVQHIWVLVHPSENQYGLPRVQ